MNKQPEITETTRNNIIEAFCELYINDSLDKITVKNVAEKSGYSRMTFYNYFSGTQDILNYMEDVFIEHVAEGIAKVVSEKRSLVGFADVFAELYCSDGYYGSVLFKQPFSTNFINRLKDRMMPIILDSFGIREDDTRARYVLEFYIPGMVSLLSKWTKNTDEVSLEEITDIIEGILKDGVWKQLELLASISGSELEAYMNVTETILKRRSVRKYTDEAIAEEKLKLIVQAGLLAPTGKNKKPCEFYVVHDREALTKLAAAKAAGSGMIVDANAAIVVAADSQLTDTWVEDSSVAMSYMSLEAAAQGVGNCWVQMHLRKDSEGEDAEANVRTILAIENESMRIVGVLALGMPAENPAPYTEDDADWSKVHEV